MDHEDAAGRAPHWFVTFSDMTCLLLTFFVMMASFSELKSEEKYEALMDGFQQQFGSADDSQPLSPGALRPRNSRLAKLLSGNRDEPQNTPNVTSQVLIDKGHVSHLAVLEANPRPIVGTVLYFQEDQIELDQHQRSLLRQLAEGLRGRPRQIEIRGRSSSRPAATGTPVRDSWDLSFERCRRVMRYLVDEQRVSEQVLRVSVTSGGGATATDESPSSPGCRVELLLFEEVVAGAAEH